MTIVLSAGAAKAQQPLTPELLWKLGRVSPETITPDGQAVIYGVTRFNADSNTSKQELYRVGIRDGKSSKLTGKRGSVVHVEENGNILLLHNGQLSRLHTTGELKQLTNAEGKLSNVRISPDGKHLLFTKRVAIHQVVGKDRYTDLPKSDAYVFDDLNYRHWDTWSDGKHSHLFYATYDNGQLGKPVDLLEGEPYDVPQQPFGGTEDAIWVPDGKSILYVAKKKSGKAYALSTNTDIYRYDLASGTTTNLTEGMQGYDTHPVYSPDGKWLAWLSMAEDGYESDKNDMYIMQPGTGRRYNLTGAWDETVHSFIWSNDGTKIWFTGAVKGTVQVFELLVPENPDNRALPKIRQLTGGQFDVTDLVGQSGNQLIVNRTDMNHAAELYKVGLDDATFTQLTRVNDRLYAGVAKSRIEGRTTKATDGKDLFSWVIYPPDFDPSKKYPTLLYCQGGPQGALSQFYSFRWNFQLIAAQGYIVIAPNRRGMPGYGVDWNRQISGDWGGQAIRDYLSAIDDLAREPYVDKHRLGAVGASYGGYSVFMLAGIHHKRFKTFIAHDGLFDMRSWYGTTEELFFANKDLGGAYWDSHAARSYTDFNPITHGDKWDTPILIVQGGKDFRVGIEQGLQAFQQAQLKGIKSRLLYLPEENHWVLTPQNALVWQREFFGWLRETLVNE